MSTSRIAGHLSLKRIPIPQVTALSVFYASHHAYAVSAIRYVDNSNHPLHEAISRRWASRTEPLWWTSMTSIKAGGTRKVVRGWMNKRAKTAFAEALQRRGYNRDGSRLEPAEGRPVPKGDIEGSLNFMVQSPMLKTPWEELQKQADIVVNVLEKRQKWQPNGGEVLKSSKAQKVSFPARKGPQERRAGT